MMNKLTKLTNYELLYSTFISQTIQEYMKILKVTLYDKFDWFRAKNVLEPHSNLCFFLQFSMVFFLNKAYLSKNRLLRSRLSYIFGKFMALVNGWKKSDGYEEVGL